MSIMKIDPTVELTPILPTGRYGDGDVDVKVISAEVRDVPGPNEDNEQYLDLAVMVPHTTGAVFVHTSPFRNHTKLTPNSGSKVMQFLKQLGVEKPEQGFELEDLVQAPVVVDVTLREWNDKTTGELRSRNDIQNIYLKA